MATLKITWRTQQDDRVCKICRVLESYTWTFEAGKDAFPTALTHPAFGVVWDVARGSMAHGHTNINCRCTLVPEIDLKDLLERVQKLYDEMAKEASGNVEA